LYHYIIQYNWYPDKGLSHWKGHSLAAEIENVSNAKRDVPKIAVLIPCHNEQATVGKVVDEMRRELSSAVIYVFDNCSTDSTASIAKEHGAVVIKEPRLGKGFVVESMFSRIDADIYVMIDGDDTYPAGYAGKLLEPLLAGDADMVVGARLTNYGDGSFRPLHLFGNNLICWLVNWMGSAHLTDIMSGYRAFSRHVVECIPVVSSGFEVETEMTIQMLYYRMKIVEINIPYQKRPVGSVSKLNTLRDGLRVSWKLFSLFRAFKPLTFFGSVGLLFLVLGIIAGIPPIRDYLTDPNHIVRHIPLAILATGLMILSCICIFLGILLHAINWRFHELHNVLTRKPAKTTR
jgi:glycosyltransferase involved in cell wall biosynthesis